MSSSNNIQNKIESISTLEEGDRILFNERATPLTVEKTSNEEAKVQGPQGGEYVLYTEEDAKYPLVAKPGSKKYSSYAKNLRKVGKWQKTGDRIWIHTKTDARISVKKNQVGFWTLKIENFDENIDLPKYGFSDQERAVEEAEKIINDNPEG